MILNHNYKDLRNIKADPHNKNERRTKLANWKIL